MGERGIGLRMRALVQYERKTDRERERESLRLRAVSSAVISRIVRCMLHTKVPQTPSQCKTIMAAVQNSMSSIISSPNELRAEDCRRDEKIDVSF